MAGPSAADSAALMKVGEKAPTHIGVQNPHRPADLVGLRSPPNLSRWDPFCQLSVSTSSNRRVLRALRSIEVWTDGRLIRANEVEHVRQAAGHAGRRAVRRNRRRLWLFQ